jgi:arsenate reductase-like glutaredoxin family protein
VRLVPLDRLINLRHEVAKSNGWKDKLPSKTAFITAALEENNLVRRPVLIDGENSVVGSDEDAIRALLAKS